jgi:flagellar hook-basal body complex protein FliE
MNISQLQRARIGQQVQPGDDTGQLPVPRSKSGSSSSSFKDTLENAIGDVDQAQKTSDQQIEAFVSGEQDNVHEVMISMQEANLSFDLMVEVRNRVLEGYQELMRMQV